MELLTIQYQDIEKDVIDKYLAGNIFHITKENNFTSIISDFCIYAPNPDKYLPNYSQTSISFGYKEKAVCLLDYRNIIKNENYKTSQTMFYTNCYIFILNKTEHCNIIPSKSNEEFRPDMYLIPEYECWYKDKISLDKIEKIIYIQKFESEEELAAKEHCLLEVSIKYEKELELELDNTEILTTKKLIKTLNCNEEVTTFRQKRSFIFNFAMIWNLFEDICMSKKAQISKVNNLVASLISVNNLEVDAIFDYFKDRYKVADNIYNIESLSWRSNENTYRNFVIEKFRDTQCSHQNKIKAVLYIIFRLRNNLFHGEKDIAIINEQKQTFVLVNKFLMDLITL